MLTLTLKIIPDVTPYSPSAYFSTTMSVRRRLGSGHSLLLTCTCEHFFSGSDMRSITIALIKLEFRFMYASLT